MSVTIWRLRLAFGMQYVIELLISNYLLTSGTQVMAARNAAGKEFEKTKLFSDVNEWLSVKR